MTRNHSRCIVATIESDSHMWNLVYLQLWLEERGWDVTNLGCCTPGADIVDAIGRFDTDLLIISSVNGNGLYQGRQLIHCIRRQHALLRCVIGGKLTTNESDNPHVRTVLTAAGYDAVFVGNAALKEFSRYLADASLGIRTVMHLA